jgi:hypothetical protein
MMLGTFSPQAEPYTYAGEEETTPAGMFARGSYSAKLKVTLTLIKVKPQFCSSRHFSNRPTCSSICDKKIEDKVKLV